MYRVDFSSNPANWEGPVWGIATYLVFRGLQTYGMNDEARDMADRAIRLFGEDYVKSGSLHESYNPDSGAPIGGAYQSWNYLVANMLAWRQNRAVVKEF